MYPIMDINKITKKKNQRMGIRLKEWRSERKEAAASGGSETAGSIGSHRGCLRCDEWRARRGGEMDGDLTVMNRRMPVASAAERWLNGETTMD